MKNPHLLGYPAAIISALAIGIVIGTRSGDGPAPNQQSDPTPQLTAIQKHLAQRNKPVPPAAVPTASPTATASKSPPSDVIVSKPNPPMKTGLDRAQIISELAIPLNGGFEFAVKDGLLIGHSEITELSIFLGLDDAEMKHILFVLNFGATKQVAQQADMLLHRFLQTLFTDAKTAALKIQNGLTAYKPPDVKHEGRVISIEHDRKKKLIYLQLNTDD